MRLFVCAIGVTALVTGAVAPASGAFINQFNLIVTGDMSLTSEVEGRTFIGGNLSGGGTFGTMLTPSAAFADVDVLLVGGNINVSNINLNAGDLRRSGLRTGGVNFNGVGSQEFVDGSVAAMVPGVAAELASTSGSLQALAANSTVTLPSDQPGPATFNAAPDAFGRAVFNINAAELFTSGLIQSIGLNLNGATSLVINVTGANVNYNNGGNFVGDWLTPAVRASAIWNFFEATSIQIDRNFNGAILAPQAHLTNTTSIDGSVFVGSFTGNGEVHLPNYVVPAPGAAALLGIAGVVASRRRRAA